VVVTTTTTTTTTTMPAAPVHAVLRNFLGRGQSPLTLAFVMCDSTDSAGVAGDRSNLDYFADFDDGDGPVEQENCSFAHTFRTDGVDRLGLTFCVRDRITAAQDCVDAPLEVAAQIQVDVDGSNTLACQGVVRATAGVVSTTRTEVHAMDAIDRMLFIAHSEGATRTREGQVRGDLWETGDWQVGFLDSVQVTAQPFSGELEGYEASDGRPACH
jgi:hypothetical protein